MIAKPISNEALSILANGIIQKTITKIETEDFDVAKAQKRIAQIDNIIGRLTAQKDKLNKSIEDCNKLKESQQINIS